MTRKEFLTSQALQLLCQNLNVIAVDNSKRALYNWKQYSEDRITEKAITEQINNPKSEGIAIICGAVSGNLEVIDFDLKHDLTGTLFDRYRLLIPDELYNKLRVVRTRSGGFHLYYRCECIEGNKKLASRPPNEQEKTDTPHLKQLVLIETRGNNGYVVAPPSTGYELVNDVEVPVISIDERDLLLDAARSFNGIHEEKRARFVSTGTPFVISPFDDYNAKADAVGLLCRHGWTVVSEDSERIHLLRPGSSTAKTSGNFHKAKNLLYVHTTSTQFNAGEAYSPAAIYTTLEHNGDFSEASKQLIKQGYGTRRTPESVKTALSNPIEVDYKFWEVTETKKGDLKINVTLTKLVNYIHKVGGFTGYKHNEKSQSIIVQVKDGIVREVEMYDIKQFLKTKIESLHDTFDGITSDELLEVIYRDYLAYMSRGFMDYLTVSQLEFLKDTKDKAYFPFRNGIVEVTKDTYKVLKYSEIKEVIWSSQLIDKIITLPEGGNINEFIDRENVDYANFIGLAAGATPSKVEYFETALGYLLHRYKDPKQSFAIVLAEEAENEADGGGTGKGLFVKGIKELIPTEIFDGKQFSPSKPFAFQRVNLDTRLCAIEDLRRGFKFEEMYSFITEGLPVEKKNAKEFYLHFHESPKFVMSTNYAINDEGNHAKRRQKVLEFSNFFSPSRTPFDVFGRMLFEGWEKDEWNRFYNYMFYCVQLYLQKGITKEDQSDSNKVKNIKLKYSEDFYFWFTSFVESAKGEVFVKHAYEDFIDVAGISSKDYSKDRFSKGVRYAASVMGFAFEDGIRKIDGKPNRFIKIAKLKQ